MVLNAVQHLFAQKDRAGGENRYRKSINDSYDTYKEQLALQNQK